MRFGRVEIYRIIYIQPQYKKAYRWPWWQRTSCGCVMLDLGKVGASYLGDDCYAYQDRKQQRKLRLLRRLRKAK